MSGSSQFSLDSRLQADTVLLASWPLSDVLIMDDAQYPWAILVPRCHGVREIYQLDEIDQKQLLAESSYIGQRLMEVFSGEKLNVAALGNVVSQLHLHHVVRFSTDKAWPGPVWGQYPRLPYSEHEQKRVLSLLKAAIADKVW